MIRKSKRAEKAREILVQGIEPIWQRIDADVIDPQLALIVKTLNSDSITPSAIARLLVEQIKTTCEKIEELRTGHDAFNSRHAVMDTDTERRQNILAYAEELGASPKQLQGDRRAFRRHFGQDAMTARFRSRLGDRQRILTILLRRLGVIAGKAIKQSSDAASEWRDLNIEGLTEQLLENTDDARIPEAAFRCLAESVLELPSEIRKSVLCPATVQKIHRLALDRERDVWIQCEAIDLVFQISSDSFDAIARTRLLDPPDDPDDIFVRQRIVPLVAAFEGWALRLCKDPSPFVRQGLATRLALVHLGEFNRVVEALALEDSEPSVRAAALLQIPSLPEITAHSNVVASSLRKEEEEYVLRVAIQVSSDAHAVIPESERSGWRAAVLPALRELHTGSNSLAVRRWAAQGRERIWCDSDSRFSDLRDRAGSAIQSIRPGKSVFLKDRIAAAMDDVTLGRVLSVVAQSDFGLDVKRYRNGIRIQRGHRFGFRYWRFRHEMKDPSPDKRQAFDHTIGRIFSGNLRIPSPLMGEMSQTKVPGEPLNISEEAGWRPYLPLVDEVISSLDENSKRKPLRVVTSEGVTKLQPPRRAIRRMKAHHSLNRRFEEFSKLRNSDSPSQYINELRALGFECEFASTEGEATEPKVAQAFSPSIIPAFAIPDYLDFSRLRDYFYSAYENSIGQLLLFLAGAFSIFLARHVYLNQRFYRLRKKIPLVVGGWGTRGKSGTERIKAAMFNALGHRMVSKTTGCEAMFLYSPAFGKVHELFLFRPYDKATIWEQVNLVGLAAKLRSHVFLWECMGLTPAYIEIIQREWMKDDISTIVNTYPDHEDLQGPAGYNIPEVMTNFLRKNGHCITSEQQMTPILASAADQLDCQLDTIGWIEPGLLTPDILNRFPYAEHPNNIALVAELGSQMGIARDFSLKEMADRVIPDLGVLKVYPEASIMGRRLQFVNGFSANERLGTLGNWKRIGFDQQNPVDEPGVWITAVVNNRADRVARSRVFASILVNDISVDRFYLIGSNLKGMVGYIREEFDVRAGDITLFPDNGETPREVCLREARRLRLATSRKELSLRLESVSEDEDPSPWKESFLTDFQEYEAFEASLDESNDHKKLDSDFKELLWKWFSRKLVVISDFHATGDQINHRIAVDTPPGYLNRIMGLQNIKGTGLDFIYRWQDWDNCYRACEKLVNRKPKIAREGLVELAGIAEFGLLCEEKVKEATAEGEREHSSMDSGFQAQLDLIRARMKESLKKNEFARESYHGDSGGIMESIFDHIVGVLESLLDGGDAVRRRKAADQIYRDLANERISPEVVGREIKILNKRQKGGWLKKDLSQRFSRRS